MKLKQITIILSLFLIISCAKKGKYHDATQRRLNYVVWNFTDTPWSGHLEDITEVIERGANIEYIDSSKSTMTTPFLNAAGALTCLRNMGTRRQGQLDSMEVEAVKIAKYLVSKGANVKALTFDKRSALHLAAQGGREKMIPILVELGLDINRKDSTMVVSTPLIMAITAGDLPTVKAVVNAGADINLCSAKDNTPLDWATNLANANNEKYRYHDQKAIAEYLKSLGAKKGKNDFKNWLQF